MVVQRETALVLLAAMLLAGCSGGGEPGRAPTPVPTSLPTSLPAAAPTSSPDVALPTAPAPEPVEDARLALPVYYVAETAAGLRLQREFHRVLTDDPASDAVREMFASATGSDPDYRNPWPTGTGLRVPVRTAADVITVDLTGLGGRQLEPQQARLAVQQLVFTVQGALQSTDPVRILLDGNRVDRLWGTVDTAEPVQRGDSYALRSLVQIDAPAHGMAVGRQVQVSGEAAVFEASLHWEVLRDGTVVRSGVTATAEGQRFAPYAFEVTLEPGVYTVRIMEDDPSDGEGRPALTDDKTITVT